jgi:hypothetical protein
MSPTKHVLAKVVGRQAQKIQSTKPEARNNPKCQKSQGSKQMSSDSSFEFPYVGIFEIVSGFDIRI